MRRLFSRAFALWIPFVVALTGVFGCIYLATQQNYRQSFNDPQVQIAEDAALRLTEGGVPADIVSHSEPIVDLQKSLALWIGVYDSSGKPLESSGVLAGEPPQPPLGLFDDTTWTFEKAYVINGMKEVHVTWQSKYDTRQALVIVHAGDRFVVVGRSMRVIEDRIIDMGHELLFGWAFTNLATLAAIGFLLLFGWL
jgi:energy-converting hydrogenase Eha subunit F